MNKSKTCFVYTLLLALTLASNLFAIGPKSTASQPETIVTHDDFDDLFNVEQDSFDDASTQHLIEQRPTAETRAGCSAQDAIDLIFALAPNVKEILQEDLYCYTNPINTRSLLDTPLFLTRLYQPPHHWYTSIDLFWNETNRANFTKSSNRIGSYLALTNEELFKLLPDSCDQYTLTIFPILANGRLEERRVGGMLQAGYAWPRFTLRSMIPLYYLERNYQLTQDEKDQLMVQFGESTEEEQERFQKDHLISDKFGFGDMRLYGDFKLFEKPTCRINGGPLITLPTAFALVKGIKGSEFKPLCTRPTIDFKELCSCLDVNSFTNLGYQAINALSAVILEQPLGNRRHLGLGAFIDWEQHLSRFVKRPWATNVHLKNFFSFEYLAPHQETRYFISTANVANYDSRDFNDPDQAESNLTFLEQELIDTIFPYDFKTKVQPGYTFWWDSQIAYQGNRMGFSMGLDFWLQGKEKLSDIKVTLPCNELALSCAPAPSAYQLKVLGSLTYTLNHPNNQWILGLSADKTCIRSGIGKDYTAVAFLRASF